LCFVRPEYVHNPKHHSFPTRRSSDLQKELSAADVRKKFEASGFQVAETPGNPRSLEVKKNAFTRRIELDASCAWIPSGYPVFNVDRKSTRLNSSHVSISYAVFCVKKKITNVTRQVLGVSGRAMLDALVQGTTDRPCSPTWRAAACARSGQHCSKCSRDASATTTPSCSGRSSRTSTTSTRR